MSKPKKLRRLQKAANMGNAVAIYRLALLYLSGTHVPKSEEMAAEWMALAAFAEYPPAVKWMEGYLTKDKEALTTAE